MINRFGPKLHTPAVTDAVIAAVVEHGMVPKQAGHQFGISMWQAYGILHRHGYVAKKVWVKKS